MVKPLLTGRAGVVSRLLIGVAVLALASSLRASAAEFRGFWIDAWGAGILSQTQVDTLLGVPGTSQTGQIRDANCNAVVIQVRRNCDANYPSSLGEPYMSGLSPSNFNALQAVINAAHDTTGGKKRIEVHAWIVTFRTSGGTVYSLHDDPPTGSLTTLDNYWPTRDSAGAEVEDKALDPGHPLAAEYTVNVAMDLVQNFDIDGIHYDYIRFTANNQGYNPTSIARYNQRYGLTGQPSSTTEQFKQWRRDQITSVVRKVYAKIQGTKPWVKQTCAGVTWNPSPTASTRAAFQNTRPYYDVYSDWDGWLQEGIMDAGIPMTYYDLAGSYSADWTRWINFLKDRHGNRHMYIGPGIYLNSLSNAITELKQTRTASPAGNYAQGFCGYSYRVPYINGTWAGFAPSLLSQVTPTWDNIPTMPWKASPTTGHISGTVTLASTGEWSDGIYGTTVSITGPENRSMRTDGTGFYAFIDLAPGTYTVTASRPGYPNAVTTVGIIIGNETGNMYKRDFALGGTAKPVISNVNAAPVTNNAATITWDTDVVADTQVEYGLTASYGQASTLDTNPATSHSVKLTALEPSTTYHYRVRSANGSGTTYSGDYTFTTTSSAVLDDIIIESRTGGQNFAWYSESGVWADSAIKSTAAGTTTTVGSRYGSTYTSVANEKHAYFTADIPLTGNYEVWTTWGAGTNRRSPIRHTVNYLGGSGYLDVDQTVNANTWMSLGIYPFEYGSAKGQVDISNVAIDVSGSMYADAVKWSWAYPASPIDLTATVASPTQVNLAWTAVDMPGGGYYKIERDGSQIGTSVAATYSDTGVPCGPHSYRVRAYATGNSGYSNTVTGVVANSCGLTISNVAASGITNSSATITWSTDQASTSRVEYGTSVSYGLSTALNSTQVTAHTQTITGLQAGTLYHYRVISTNASGSATSTDYTFTTVGPPVISEVTATGISNTGATIGWKTDQAASSRVEYGLTTSYGSSTVLDSGLVTNHSQSINGLSANTLYHYRVISASSNGTATSSDYTFRTTGPPSISDVQVASVTDSTAVVTWATDTAADSRVNFGQTTAYGSQVTDTAQVTSHSITLTGLSSCTTYHFQCVSTNSGGTATSIDRTFTTGSAPAEIVVDNVDAGATYTGTWSLISTSGYGGSYRRANNRRTSSNAAFTWTPTVAQAGYYNVYCQYPAASTNTTAATYTVTYNGGTTTATFNQRLAGSQWNLIASNLPFSAGTGGKVVLNNLTGETSGTTYVAADAVKLVYVGATLPPSDVVIDDNAPTVQLVGDWTEGSYAGGYNTYYKWCYNSASAATHVFTWGVSVPVSGIYDVYCWYNSGTNRTTAATYTVNHSGGSTSRAFDQTTGGAAWNLVASAVPFSSSLGGSVVLDNKTGEAEGTKVVIADAVRLVYVGASSSCGDTEAPTLSIGAPSVGATRGGPVSYLVTYADNVAVNAITLASSSITLNKTGTANGTVSVSGTGANTRTITVSGITGNGTIGISIAAGTAQDAAGNSCAAAGPSVAFAVDNTAPTAAISAPSSSTTSGGPVSYTVTYAGADAISLSPSSITLNSTGVAAAAVAVTGDGSTTRTVTLSGITGNGTIGISIAAGTAQDAAGNSCAAVGPSATFSVVNPVQAYAINGATVHEALLLIARNNFKFTVWGWVTPIDAGSFSVDDGSGKPVKVIWNGTTLTSSDFASASGTLDLSGPVPVLTAEAVKKLN